MARHEYTWKLGFQISSAVKLRTNKPLDQGTVLIDLYDGRKHAVQAIYPAKPADKEWSDLPDTVVHTFPVGAVPDSELVELRERTQYTPPPYAAPFLDVVFFVTPSQPNMLEKPDTQSSTLAD